jgi:hypothetical protein
MPHATSHTPSRSVSERALRAVVLGALAMLGFYLKLLSGILKVGVAAIKKVPLGSDRDRP